MTEEIPPNFDKPWSESNVILFTENARRKVLYANKSVLCVFSTVMRTMFSARWNDYYERERNYGFGEVAYNGVRCIEETHESMSVAVDYKAMKEILRIIFQVDSEILLTGAKEYDSATLVKLYKAADYLNFAHIRKMCVQKMLQTPSVEMAVTAMNLNLHDLLMDILQKLDGYSVKDFLNRSNAHPFFSKKDLVCVFKRITENRNHYYSNHYSDHDGVVIRRFNPKAEKNVLNLEEVATEIENPRINLTKKWPASDVAILTKNSAERVLYANKGTLASVSDHFLNLFFGEDMKGKVDFGMISEESNTSVIHLDVEYATMKTILSIVHHCDTNYVRDSFTEYHPVLIYDMYQVASKDQLNIPCILSLCADNLREQRSGHSLDVAFKLQLRDVQIYLIKQMKSTALVDWIRSDENSLIYRSNGKEIVLSSKKTDSILSLDDARWVYDMLNASSAFRTLW